MYLSKARGIIKRMYVCMYILYKQLHTYIPLTFIPEVVAEASQIFFQYAHVLPKNI
jgi:hypothetical protein